MLDVLSKGAVFVFLNNVFAAATCLQSQTEQEYSLCVAKTLLQEFETLPFIETSNFVKFVHVLFRIAYPKAHYI